MGGKTTDEEKEYYSLIKKVFDALAPFYDAVTFPISGLRDRVVKFAKAGNGSRILDVATGTGKQAFAFAKRGHAVAGIDISEAMLEVATRKNKYANASFKFADAVNLPFEDSSFDVSCVSFALHDMPSTIREKTLKEMARVTKREGTIIIVDYSLPKNRIGRFLIYHLVKLYERRYYSMFIGSSLEASLRKAGIEAIEELPVLLGAGRILKGKRTGSGAAPPAA